MGAVAEAATPTIVDAFEAVEFAVGSAEAGGADERREIGAGGFFDDAGEGALAKGFREQAGLAFERREIFSGVFGGRERGGKSDAIVIADDRFSLPLGRSPAAPFGRADGEAPGEEKREVGGAARGDCPLKRHDADGVMRVGLGGEFSIVGKIVPEQHGRVPPAALRPSSPDVDTGAGSFDGSENNFATHRIVERQLRALHHQAGESGAREKLVLSLHGIVDGKGDRDSGRREAGVGGAIAQDGDGQAGFFCVVRNEGRESLERDFHWQHAVFKVDAGERKFAGEFRTFETGEAGSVAGAESVFSFVGREDAGFENAGYGLRVAGLRPNRREGVVGEEAFIRFVENLPVAKLAASAQADAARADAAQRERDHLQMFAGRDARVIGGRHGLLRDGDLRRA